jgi:hypothetical protein
MAIRIAFNAPVVAIIGATGGATLALVAGLLTVAYAVVVAWRVGVDATANGLVLRGSFRVRRIAWRDIDHVEIDETRPYRMHVVTVSGSRVKISGLGPTLPFHEPTMATARKRVRELNTIRSEVLSGDRHE